MLTCCMTDYEIDISEDPIFPVIRAKNIGYLGKNVRFSCEEEYYDDYDKAKGSYTACYIDGRELTSVLEDALKGNGIISDKCSVKFDCGDPYNRATMEVDGILACFDILKEDKVIHSDEAVIYYEDSDKKMERDREYDDDDEYYEEEQAGYINLTELEMSFLDTTIAELQRECL